jgi:hypothetical protein
VAVKQRFHQGKALHVRQALGTCRQLCEDHRAIFMIRQMYEYLRNTGRHRLSVAEQAHSPKANVRIRMGQQFNNQVIVKLCAGIKAPQSLKRLVGIISLHRHFLEAWRDRNILS